MYPMPDITIYSTATCAYCHMLKNYLDSNNIKYTVKHADSDPAATRELQEKSGQLGVPFTIIKDGEKEETVLGFDKPKFDKILGLGN